MQTHYVFVDYDNTHLGNVSLINNSAHQFNHVIKNLLVTIG